MCRISERVRAALSGAQPFEFKPEYCTKKGVLMRIARVCCTGTSEQSDEGAYVGPWTRYSWDSGTCSPWKQIEHVPPALSLKTPPLQGAANLLIVPGASNSDPHSRLLALDNFHGFGIPA